MASEQMCELIKNSPSVINLNFESSFTHDSENCGIMLIFIKAFFLFLSTTERG